MERGGEGEMYGESNMETYITICKIDSQWEFAVWLRELKQGLCINLEGGMGRDMGGREHMYIYGCFMLMFDRKQQISVKHYPSIKKYIKIFWNICTLLFRHVTPHSVDHSIV